ncbi:MAG TPA: arylesterase [Rhodanobacteraceae bacterium]|nr:arylesterase [Rhodanobacteraceae bacterium]
MRAFLFLLLCCVAARALAAAPPTILVMGDSLSAAHNIPIDAGWPHLLEARLAATKAPRRVVNASISGETTMSGRGRLPALLRQYQPALVILELGANDGLQGMPLREIRENLDAMVAACRGAGAKVLLLGIELPVNYGPRYRDGLRSTYADLASKYHTGLVPFLLQGVALKPALMQADGMHPTAAGESIVFDNVWHALAPMLESKSSSSRAAGVRHAH